MVYCKTAMVNAIVFFEVISVFLLTFKETYLMSCSIFHWLLACIWVIVAYILHHLRDSSYGCKTTVSICPWCLSIFLFLFYMCTWASIRVVAMIDCSICSNRCTLWFSCCIMSLWAWSFLFACPSLHLLSFVWYVWPVVTLLGHIT